MNGEFAELYREIDGRVTRLETKVEERWKAHSDTAKIRYDVAEKKFIDLFALCGEIRDKVADLPCKERHSIYTNMNRQLGVLWTLVTLIIGALVWRIVNG